MAAKRNAPPIQEERNDINLTEAGWRRHGTDTLTGRGSDRTRHSTARTDTAGAGHGTTRMGTDMDLTSHGLTQTRLDMTSPVAANQHAAGAFFVAKMATQGLTSPVAANQLAAKTFFLRNGHRWI